jgi:hypothetical protein
VGIAGLLAGVRRQRGARRGAVSCSERVQRLGRGAEGGREREGVIIKEGGRVGGSLRCHVDGEEVGGFFWEGKYLEREISVDYVRTIGGCWSARRPWEWPPRGERGVQRVG